MAGRRLIIPRRSVRVDNATLILSIEEVKNLAAKQGDVEGLSQILRRFEQRQTEDGQHHRQQLCRMEDQLEQQRSSSSAMLSSLESTVSAVSEVKQMLEAIGQTVAHNHIGRTNHKFFQGPTKGHVIFEDALGHIDPLPMGWISSWEVR